MHYARQSAFFLLALLCVCSCSKQVGNREIREAYTYYAEAPATLAKQLSSSVTDASISEELTNEAGTYTRLTRMDRTSGDLSINHAFKNYQPAKKNEVTLNGTMVVTKNGDVFQMNGNLAFSGACPVSAITLKAVSFRQKTADDDGPAEMLPLGGEVAVDKRIFTTKDFFLNVLGEPDASPSR
jgi:hypothetical protein